MWMPTQKTRLLLKQMGVTQATITSCLQSFKKDERIDGHLVSCHTQINDKGFITFVLNSTALDDESHAEIKKAALLPLSWQENHHTVKLLADKGLTAQLIADYRDLFILQSREQGRLMSNADYCFRLFCGNRPVSVAKRLPIDWRPSDKVIRTLTKTGALADDVQGFVPHFRLRWSEAITKNNDWNSVFQQEYRNQQRLMFFQ